MKQFNYRKGKGGELIARDFLIAQGFSLLEMNYKNTIGEIDLIMIDRCTLVFIEVKFKTDDLYGMPEEMITKKKLTQVRRVAELYLVINPKIHKLYPQHRIDAVCILGSVIHHYKNIDL